MPEPEAKDNTPEAAPGQAEDGVEKTESKRGPPPGVVPLFFSGPSQQIFECVVDVDLTDSNPHKLVPKQKILDDFKNRAAVCDFHPVKQKMLEYPGEEILLVYDYDFKYEENFYVCITEEAKELVLNPPVEEGDEGDGGEGEVEEVYEIPKTPEPKEWVCLGSDLEILKSQVHTTRPLVQYTVSKKRHQFNCPISYSDSSGLEAVEIVSVPDPEEETPPVRMELETGVQAVEETREVSCQTERSTSCNAVVQYEARTITESDTKSAMEDEKMVAFLQQVCPRLEVCLQQNLILDLFVDDCTALSDEDWLTGTSSGSHLKEYQSFTDLKFSKDKVINWIEWHPVIKGVIAVACGEGYSADERIDLSTRLTTSPALVLIWCFTDPIHPQLFLEAPEDIVCVKFNPSDPNIIAGGCINGQVVLWDVSEYEERLQIHKSSEQAEERSRTDNMEIFNTDVKLDHAPIVSPSVLSSLEHSHSLSLSHIHWIPEHIEICVKSTRVLKNTSKFSHQLISCGIDGCVMMWDTRPQQSIVKKTPTPQKITTPSLTDLDLTWKPFYKIPLPRSELPKTFSATRVSLKEKHREKGRHAKKKEEQEQGNEGSEIEKQNSIHPIVSPTDAGSGPEIDAASTQYFIGTEDGEIVCGDWTPSRDHESGKLLPSRPQYFSYGHSGTVTCLDRSPFYRDIVLTAGGWTWNIWREGEKNGPLLSSSSCKVQYTGGAWSPSRPGVFFLCQINGGLEVWDLMDRSHEPSLSQNISSLPITSISSFRITSKQEMLAVGDSTGTLHILEVPWNLRNPSENEEVLMEGFFERETKRVVFTSGRAASRAAVRKDLAAAASTEIIEEESAGPVELETWQDIGRKEYEEYLRTENKLLIELGIVEPLPPHDDN